jgi:hypothetical protein
MTTEEFLDKIEVCNHKERFKTGDGLSHVVTLIGNLSWYDKLFFYYVLGFTGSKWIYLIYSIYFMVEFKHMNFLDRLYYFVFFRNSYAIIDARKLAKLK